MVHRDTGAWFGKGQVGREVSMKFLLCTPEGGGRISWVYAALCACQMNGEDGRSRLTEARG